MSWTIEQKKKAPTLKDPILLVGLPGIANVGKIVVDFIIDSKKAECIAELHSHALPHTVFVNESSLIQMPKIELFHLKTEHQDILLLSGDAQPVDERAAHEFCETLIQHCRGLGCTSIVSIGGIALKKIPKKPKVFVTGTHKKHVDTFCKNTPCNSKVYGIVGPIIGVTGLIVAQAGKTSLPNACVLVETYGHPFYLGIPGAREVLQVLDNKYQLKLDLSSLDEEIKEMEADLFRASSLKAKPQKKEISYIG